MRYHFCMSKRPSDDFGKRLARYRRLAGLSAQQLSDILDGEISRGVIANMESGRKRDVTIDQLVALSWALDVPPVALALPLDEPHRYVKLFVGKSSGTAMRSSHAVEWFLARKTSIFRNDPPGPGAALSRALIDAVEKHLWAQASWKLTNERFDEGKADQRRLDEDEKYLAESVDLLRSLGADTTMYEADD
jgi:transcriptional regulator with XRE-family HTH domain